MQIDVLTNPLDYEAVYDKAVVVIDILRVSSTIVTAVESNAKRIYPVLTVEEAFEKREHLIKGGESQESVLLAGERQGIKVKGFNMGNSPLEYTKDKVGGKILVLSSTNGTKAIKRNLKSKILLVGSFLNGYCVANKIVKEGIDTLFYLSGKLGDFSYEDAVGAGFIIDMVLGSKNISLSDSSMMCHDLYLYCKNDLKALMYRVNHGKYLESLGFGKDLDYCAQTNISSIVPQVLEEGYIVSV